ncbi:MAG: hypothetical protein JSS07_04125 [Proteobacteria bacterium]|nr:hypothetical protein [Pseudomonadota bacterium]
MKDSPTLQEEIKATTTFNELLEVLKKLPDSFKNLSNVTIQKQFLLNGIQAIKNDVSNITTIAGYQAYAKKLGVTSTYGIYDKVIELVNAMYLKLPDAKAHMKLEISAAEWQSAENYFYLNPTQVKYSKKLYPFYIKHSFIKVNDQIYAVANKNDPNVKTSQGGEGKVKVVQNKNDNNFMVKIEGRGLRGFANTEKQITDSLGFTLGEAQIDMKKFFLGKNIDKKLYTIMKIIGEKDLLEYLNVFLTTGYSGPLTTKNYILLIAYKCCESIQALHDRNIIHADIKASNFRAKINDLNIFAIQIDYGLSKKLTPGSTTAIAKNCGTFDYMAPELWPQRIASMNVPFSFASDVYALGVMFQKELQVDSAIYSDMIKRDPNQRSTLNQVMDNILNTLLKDPTLTPEITKFVKGLKSRQKMQNLVDANANLDKARQQYQEAKDNLNKVNAELQEKRMQVQKMNANDYLKSSQLKNKEKIIENAKKQLQDINEQEQLVRFLSSSKDENKSRLNQKLNDINDNVQATWQELAKIQQKKDLVEKVKESKQALSEKQAQLKQTIEFEKGYVQDLALKQLYAEDAKVNVDWAVSREVAAEFRLKAANQREESAQLKLNEINDNVRKTQQKINVIRNKIALANATQQKQSLIEKYKNNQNKLNVAATRLIVAKETEHTANHFFAVAEHKLEQAYRNLELATQQEQAANSKLSTLNQKENSVKFRLNKINSKIKEAQEKLEFIKAKQNIIKTQKQLMRKYILFSIILLATIAGLGWAAFFGIKFLAASPLFIKASAILPKISAFMVVAAALTVTASIGLRQYLKLQKAKAANSRHSDLMPSQSAVTVKPLIQEKQCEVNAPIQNNQKHQLFSFNQFRINVWNKISNFKAYSNPTKTESAPTKFNYGR